MQTQIFATFPNLCLPNEDWVIPDLSEYDQRYCYHLVKDLTHGEQEAWAVGILPSFCDDFSAGLFKADDLPEEQWERCTKEKEARGGDFNKWLFTERLVLRIFRLLLITVASMLAIPRDECALANHFCG